MLVMTMYRGGTGTLAEMAEVETRETGVKFSKAWNTALRWWVKYAAFPQHFYHKSGVPYPLLPTDGWYHSMAC